MAYRSFEKPRPVIIQETTFFRIYRSGELNAIEGKFLATDFKIIMRIVELFKEACLLVSPPDLENTNGDGI